MKEEDGGREGGMVYKKKGRRRRKEKERKRRQETRRVFHNHLPYRQHAVTVDTLKSFTILLYSFMSQMMTIAPVYRRE